MLETAWELTLSKFYGVQIEQYIETGSIEEATDKAEEGVKKAAKEGKSTEAAADMALKFL